MLFYFPFKDPIHHLIIYLTATETHSDTPMWRNERIVALAMIPLIPTAIAFPSMPMDFALSSAMVLHCHWFVKQHLFNTLLYFY